MSSKAAVLVVDKGMRGHAFAYFLNNSPHVGTVYWVGANAGAYSLSKFARDVDYSRLETPADYAAFAEDKCVQLVIPGSETYLYEGVGDHCKRLGIPCLGPTKAASKFIEGEKGVSKLLMELFDVPTAPCIITSSAEKARLYRQAYGKPTFDKASGSALGKGALPGETTEESMRNIDRILVEGEFGDAGKIAVIEDWLPGLEASGQILVNTHPDSGNGPLLIEFPATKDYKRIGERCRTDSSGGMVGRGDVGGQTGGMGVYSRPHYFTSTVAKNARDNVVLRLVNGLIDWGIEYCGVIYPAYIIDGDNVYVLEFNARFGSPEGEGALPLLENDFYEVAMGVTEGSIKPEDVKFSDARTVGIVLASGPLGDKPGYPEDGYAKGEAVTGLDRLDGDVMFFHGGTRTEDGGKTVLTDGGRVGIVVAKSRPGDAFEATMGRALLNAEKIRYANKYYRDDVGNEELGDSEE